MLPPVTGPVDRRSERRYPYVCDVDPVSSASPLDGYEPIARGMVLNVSTGGACIVAQNCSIEAFSVLPCKFQFPGVPVGVPVLAQVRWIEHPPADATRLRIGVSFLP